MATAMHTLVRALARRRVTTCPRSRMAWTPSRSTRKTRRPLRMLRKQYDRSSTRLRTDEMATERCICRCDQARLSSTVASWVKRVYSASAKRAGMDVSIRQSTRKKGRMENSDSYIAFFSAYTPYRHMRSVSLRSHMPSTPLEDYTVARLSSILRTLWDVVLPHPFRTK